MRSVGDYGEEWSGGSRLLLLVSPVTETNGCRTVGRMQAIAPAWSRHTKHIVLSFQGLYQMTCLGIRATYHLLDGTKV